jgi:hypothetical protein
MQATHQATFVYPIHVSFYVYVSWPCLYPYPSMSMYILAEYPTATPVITKIIGRIKNQFLPQLFGGHH